MAAPIEEDAYEYDNEMIEWIRAKSDVQLRRSSAQLLALGEYGCWSVRGHCSMLR